MTKTNSTFKKITSLLLSLAFVISSFAVIDFSQSTAIEAKADAQEYYLMGYFTGNGNATTSTTENQANRLALSTDGVKFSALNKNKPIITQTKGTLNARDPYLFAGQDGYYYMICTDQDYSDNNWGKLCSTFVIWRSRDLITWEDETIIDIHDLPGCSGATINYAWAPQVGWDSAANKYMIYFAFKDNYHTERDYGYNCQMMYYIYATDLLDVSTWEEPQCLFDRRGASIDGDITEQDGTFYMFYKDETKATVCLATANAMNGPYTFVGKLDTSAATGGIEGCQVYKVGNNYYLDADRYGDAGKFVIYNLGTDLAAVADAVNNEAIPVNDGNPVSTVEETQGFSNLQARHGSVIHISKTQFDSLMKAYGGSSPDDITFSFDRSYTAENAWHYDNINDASGYGYDMMTNTGGYAYIIPKSNYLSLNGATMFCNDSRVKEIFNQGNSWTVAFNANVVQSRNAPLFALCSGDSPAGSIDWVRLLDNGKLVLYYDGAYHEVGSTELTTSVDYRFTLTYNGSKIILYKNGKEAVSYTIASIPYDRTKSTSPVAFGWTDTIGVTAVNAAYSNVRIRSRAITAAEAANEYSTDAFLAYNYNEGTETVDGRSNVTYNGGGFGTTYTGKRGASFAVASWVNIGADKNTGLLDSARAMLFEFGSGGTGNGKNYLGMTEDGKFRFCWSEGSTARYVDVNDVYDFAVNTWYYLQINIIPDGDQWHIRIFVNGVSAADVTSGYNNMRSYDYSPINMLSQESFPLYFGIGHAYWTTAGYNLIDDFRVYNSAVDPAEIYREIEVEDVADVARDYVRANLESYDVNASANKANRAAYHYGNIATNGYNNVLACSTSTNNKGLTTYNGQSYNFFWPADIVLMYDGVNTPALPVTLEQKKNGNTRTINTIFVNQSSNPNFHNAHYWTGYIDKEWTVWPGDSKPYNYEDGITNQNGKLSGGQYIGYGDGSQYDYDYSNTTNTGTSRFFWNKLNYTKNSNVDTTNYYELYTSIPYRVWDGGARDITDTSHNIYIVNYKPIYDILKSSSPTAMPNGFSGYGLKQMYTLFIKDNESNYTEDSLNQFYYAAYKVLTCNPMDYSEAEYQANFSNTVTRAAAEIKQAVAEFNNINLKTRADFSALDSAYNSANSVIDTLGTNSQAKTTTSINALSDVVAGLTYEPNDGTINRANVPQDLYQNDIDAETNAVNAAITALDTIADLSEFDTAFDRADEFLTALEGKEAQYTASSVQALINAMNAGSTQTYANADETARKDYGQEVQTAVNGYKNAINTAYDGIVEHTASVDTTAYVPAHNKIVHLDIDAYEENEGGSIATAITVADGLVTTSTTTYDGATINVVDNGVSQTDVDDATSGILTALSNCVKKYDITATEGVTITANNGTYEDGKATYGAKITFDSGGADTAWFMSFTSASVSRNEQYLGYGSRVNTNVVGALNVRAVKRDPVNAPNKVTIVRQYSNDPGVAPVISIDFAGGTYALQVAPVYAHYDFIGYYDANDNRLDNPEAAYPQNISIKGNTRIIAKYSHDAEKNCAVMVQNTAGNQIYPVNDSDAVAYNTKITVSDANAVAWVETVGTKTRLFNVGSTNLTFFATESATVKAVTAEQLAALGLSEPSYPIINIKQAAPETADIDGSKHKFIFNAQILEGTADIQEYGILIGKEKIAGTFTDDMLVVENAGSGVSANFSIVRAKATKKVGADQISIALNTTMSGEYVYRAYAIYKEGNEIKTKYSEVMHGNYS